jgi:hypothetical protein
MSEEKTKVPPQIPGEGQPPLPPEPPKDDQAKPNPDNKPDLIIAVMVKNGQVMVQAPMNTEADKDKVQKVLLDAMRAVIDYKPAPIITPKGNFIQNLKRFKR